MESEIHGYKIFDKNFKAISGDVFEEEETYIYDGEIRVQKSGFHFAKRLEDTLRYSNALKEDVIIAQVTALGNTIKFSDDFYEYFDLYVTDKIRIDKVLTRQEIVDYALKLDDLRLRRFIGGLKLKPVEIRQILNKDIQDAQLLRAISYYQLSNEMAFSDGTFLEDWKKVKRYGKYNYKGSKRK